MPWYLVVCATKFSLYEAVVEASDAAFSNFKIENDIFPDTSTPLLVKVC